MRFGQTYGDGDRSWYDGQIVCLNGHQLSANLSLHQQREKYCPDCDAPTLTDCPGCSTAIRGAYNVPGVIAIMSTAVPKHCFECGKPFPWQSAAIENLRSLLREGGLDEADMATATAAIPDIVAATPRTDGAAITFKRLLSKVAKPAYEATVKVVSEVASEVALKAMGFR